MTLDQRAAGRRGRAALGGRARPQPIGPLTQAYPGIDVTDAYEIQPSRTSRQPAGRAGARVRGHKVGLSSPVMQQMMGVDEPDYGHLLEDMVLPQDAPIRADWYCYPRIEVEIGYVLGASLPGEGCTTEDVLAATEYITASLELIDSRIAGWRIKLADTIADNASSAGVILGAQKMRPQELKANGIDLANIEAVLYSTTTGPVKNSPVYHRGRRASGPRSPAVTPAAVLGNPTTAVAWLAGKVASSGSSSSSTRASPHPARLLHPGVRRPAGRGVPRRLRRPSATVTAYFE